MSVRTLTPPASTGGGGLDEAEVTAIVDTSIANHAAAADPHAGYQKESEKDAAGGYAGLSGSTKLAGAQQTYGSGSNTACEGNDSRLSDARTPTAHKTSHQDGGGDEISVAGLSGLLADGQTPLAHDIITAHNGFPGGTSNFLRADGTFAAPTAVAGDLDMPETGSLTIATAKYHITAVRHSATGSQRITVQGTGRWRLQN